MVWRPHREDLRERPTDLAAPAKRDKVEVRRGVDTPTMPDASAANVYRRPTATDA